MISPKFQRIRDGGGGNDSIDIGWVIGLLGSIIISIIIEAFQS